MSSRFPFRTYLARHHVAFENFGTLASLFRDRGFQIRYVQAGSPCPSVQERQEVDCCVVLGGSVGKGAEERYPCLKAELDWIRMRLERQLPLLGVCLGAQMMAQALGSRVYPGMARETGWPPVSLTESGRRFPLRHLEETPVLHWHGDTFDVPSDARLLESTEMILHHAFCAGRHAQSLQFRVEAGISRMDEWPTGHACELMAAGTDICGLRAASVRNGIRLAWRTALCMNQ